MLISIGAAYLFQRAANQALWEGVLGIAAAVSVASLTVHMWRTARRIKRDIEGHLHSSTMKTGRAAFLGVFVFTLLMITREGMETALLMGTLLFQMKSISDHRRRRRRHVRRPRSSRRCGRATAIASTSGCSSR